MSRKFASQVIPSTVPRLARNPTFPALSAMAAQCRKNGSTRSSRSASSLKGLHALFEIVGGIALYLTSTATILGWIDRFTADELSQDPDDWVANHLFKFGQTFSVAQHDFFAFYLLSHGIVKIVLVYGLLKEKLWAYPASFVVFTALHRLPALPLQLHP